MSRILDTGAAGFVGYHLSKRLLQKGEQVVGVENLTPYYDVTLKHARLARLRTDANFSFLPLDLADRIKTENLFGENGFDFVVNLAAQAGVRYSMIDPSAYVVANVVGFLNVLEGCRRQRVRHLVSASSRSVYGTSELDVGN